MNSIEMEFNPISFVLVKLLRGPIYQSDHDDWETLRSEHPKIRDYFRRIGQELVFDEIEGYAFLRQLELDGVERIPRLTQRRPLSYQATLLLVCLREEFCRFETGSPESNCLIKTRSQLHNMVAAFLPETTNQVRDQNKIDTAIKRLEDLGFLVKASEELEEFEIKKIIKARLGPSELESIKERLKKYATSVAD